MSVIGLIKIDPSEQSDDLLRLLDVTLDSAAPLPATVESMSLERIDADLPQLQDDLRHELRAFRIRVSQDG